MQNLTNQIQAETYAEQVKNQISNLVAGKQFKTAENETVEITEVTKMYYSDVLTTFDPDALVKLSNNKSILLNYSLNEINTISTDDEELRANIVESIFDFRDSITSYLVEMKNTKYKDFFRPSKKAAKKR